MITQHYRHRRPAYLPDIKSQLPIIIKDLPKSELSQAIAMRCVHLGKLLDRTKCGSEVWNCRKHGTCSWQRKTCAGGLKFCGDCEDWESDSAPIRFDQSNLSKSVGGYRFNTSIIDHGDYYTIAFRNGWKGSEIFCQRMSHDWKEIGGPVHLRLIRREANYGREDPRLFWHKGALHIAYIGVTGVNNIVNTNVLFARLGPNYEVQDTFAPRYQHRKGNEKNWQFFDYENQLYAVYTIKPHVILQIDSNDAKEVYRTNDKWEWSGGMRRGGASPVRVGDEYICFFHGKIMHNTTYNIGVYSFEAKPPFRITRFSKQPIYEAVLKTKPADQYCPVIFPCGAVQQGEDWLISCGVHDRWTEIHRFSKRLIEGAMS